MIFRTIEILFVPPGSVPVPRTLGGNLLRADGDGDGEGDGVGVGDHTSSSEALCLRNIHLLLQCNFVRVNRLRPRAVSSHPHAASIPGETGQLGDHILRLIAPLHQQRYTSSLIHHKHSTMHVDVDHDPSASTAATGPQSPPSPAIAAPNVTEVDVENNPTATTTTSHQLEPAPHCQPQSESPSPLSHLTPFATSFLALPPELLTHILMYLAPDDLGVLSRVVAPLAGVERDRYLWAVWVHSVSRPASLSRFRSCPRMHAHIDALRSSNPRPRGQADARPHPRASDTPYGPRSGPTHSN